MNSRLITRDWMSRDWISRDRLKAVLSAVGCGLLSMAACLNGGAHAATVYVSESADDVTMTNWTSAGGSGTFTPNDSFGGTQNGSFANPFGSIQAAIRSLWGTSGSNEIRLIGDGDGIFMLGELGTNQGDTAFPGIKMLNNGVHFPNAYYTSPFGSLTITADDPVNNPVRLRYVKSQTSNSDINGGTRPDAGSNGAGQGLINPGTIHGLTMTLKDLDVELDGGTYLIGSSSQSTGSNSSNTVAWNLTLDGVNLFMKSDTTDETAGINDNFGRSGLWFSTHSAYDIDNSGITFNNSKIYYDETPRAGTTYQPGLMVAHGFAFSDAFRQADFIKGSGNSRIYKWSSTLDENGDPVISGATLHTNLQDNIWAGMYNGQSLPTGIASNNVQNNENGTWWSGGSMIGATTGGVTAPQFLTGFLTTEPAAPAVVPEIDPAGMGSVLALVTAGLGLLERRRKLKA